MSPWVTSSRAKTFEDVAFLSGAALSQLHVVVGRDDFPHVLLRDRLALRAAEACVRISGRPERARELHDAVRLLRAGDQPGPAGEIYLHWRRAVAGPVSVKSLHRAVSIHAPDQIAAWLNGDDGRSGIVPSAVGQVGPIG